MKTKILSLVSLVMLIYLFSSCGEGMQTPDATDRSCSVQFKNPRDRATFSPEGSPPSQRNLLEIHSSTGIGECTVKRNRDAWPERLTLRFPLRGLEQLTIHIGPCKWQGSVSSVDGTVHWTRSMDNGPEEPLASDDPQWCAIRIADSPELQPISIPLKEDQRFEIPIPVQWLGTNPDSIRIAWIDFFR